MPGLRELLKRTPLRLAYAYYRHLMGRRGSQYGESIIIGKLAEAVGAPHTFVEFGFHIHEFNCLEQAKTWRGLLIDGDEGGVKIARRLLPKAVDVRSMFLTLDTLDVVRSAFAPGSLGVLSIDVDGNDYWFLEALIDLKPSVISVEYNASLGTRPITVPYDPSFVRTEKHPSGWYHGASITALTKLCAAHGYDLVAVDDGGANAFFVRSDQRPETLPVLDPLVAHRANRLRNEWSNTTVEQQWDVIGGQPYVTV